MDRLFEIGDRVVCNDSGVIGKVLKFYKPTACDEQTLIKTDDGREYHAPTSTWIKTTEAGNTTIKLPLVSNEENCIAVIGRGSSKSWLMAAIKQYNQ